MSVPAYVSDSVGLSVPAYVSDSVGVSVSACVLLMLLFPVPI